jgi:hypothetical protein
MGKSELARKGFILALEIKKNHYGEDHIEFATTL